MTKLDQRLYIYSGTLYSLAQGPTVEKAESTKVAVRDAYPLCRPKDAVGLLFVVIPTRLTD